MFLCACVCACVRACAHVFVPVSASVTGHDRPRLEHTTGQVPEGVQTRRRVCADIVFYVLAEVAFRPAAYRYSYHLTAVSFSPSILPGKI